VPLVRDTAVPLLEGRVALITGGGSGLGEVTSRLFAAEGAKIVIADVNAERGESVAGSVRAEGGDAIFVPVDVRRLDELEAAVGLAEERYGALHLVVANAGVLGRASFTPSDQVAVLDFAEVLDINLTGTFRTFRAAIPALRRAGGGAFTATSSTAGIYANLYRVAYSASKAGINSLVRGLAVELAPDNIRVNAVCPGSMDTNVLQSTGRPADALGVQRPDMSGKARLAMRRPGRDTTLEVARAHLFLCSDLSGYVNGEALVIDGGFSIWNGS
jgi:NAD(P)-dependent dehydrogenase (short-subunit alcohol dehydrogenase family)